MKKKSARLFSKVKILKFTLVVVFIVGYLLFSVYFKLFTIQAITCSSDDGNCTEPVVAELNHLKDTYFFSPTVSSTVTKIIRSDPYISEIEVQPQFPHSIAFYLKKKKPFAEIMCENTSLFVDSVGKVEENTRSLHLNTSTVPASQLLCDNLIATGTTDMSAVHDMVNFSQTVTQSTPELKMEWSDHNTVLLQTPTQQKIVLPLHQLDRSFQMYQYLLDQSQLPEGWIELDLRFQKAIVKTQ